MRSRLLFFAFLAFALTFTSTASAQLMLKNIDVNGVNRKYLMYLPAGYTGTTDLPVLLVYHGGDMTAFDMLLMTGMRPMADENNFILVYPQGLPEDGSPIWNSEGPFTNGVDELGFTAAMIDDLDAGFAVNQSRVYACGYSNGGNMAWELACLLSDRIAAVGAVAGSMWTWTAQMSTATRPVPVVSIHGTWDFYNNYWDGAPYSLGLMAASEFWAQHNGANLTPIEEDLPNISTNDGSTVTKFSWPNGDDCVAVEHYRVVRGGHDWPGIFGNMDIDTNEIIWEFVSRYDLDGKIPTCSVMQIGVGAGGANIATLDSASTPTLGSTVQFDFSGFNGADTGFMIVSLQRNDMQILGGTVFPDTNNLKAMLPVSTNANGSGSFSLTLGTNLALDGLTAYAQVAVRDVSQVDGWAFSNGLAVTVCECR